MPTPRIYLCAVGLSAPGTTTSITSMPELCFIKVPVGSTLSQRLMAIKRSFIVFVLGLSCPILFFVFYFVFVFQTTPECSQLSLITGSGISFRRNSRNKSVRLRRANVQQETLTGKREIQRRWNCLNLLCNLNPRAFENTSAHCLCVVHNRQHAIWDYEKLG